MMKNVWVLAFLLCSMSGAKLGGGSQETTAAVCMAGLFEQAFEALVAGLPPHEGTAVTLAVFDNCAHGLSVRPSRSSDSPALQRIRYLANAGFVTRIDVRPETESFDTLVPAPCHHRSGTCVEKFDSIFGGPNYVSLRSAVPGQTLVPLSGAPLRGVLYTPASEVRVYVGADQSVIEAAVTIHHELVHAELFVRGQPFAHSEAVDALIAAAERDARRHAEGLRRPDIIWPKQ